MPNNPRRRPAAALRERPAAGQFDVFLSYNRRDEASVRELADTLRAEGISPWLDTWYCTPGVPFHAEVLDGLNASRSCAVLVGPHGLGDWEREELGVALNRAATEPAFHVFAVLLPGLAPVFGPNNLPPFLATRTCVDLRAGLASGPAWRALVEATHGRAPGPSPAEGPPVTAEDRSLFLEPVPSIRNFVGRQGELAKCRQRLKRERWLLIDGPEGIGKTALAAQLAAENAACREDIFWFTFDPVEKNTLDAVLGALAVFMAERGERKLWTYLASDLAPSESTWTRPLSLTVKANLIGASVAAHPFVLCFDDVHIASDSAEIGQLFKTIHQQFAGAPAELASVFILMGREFSHAFSNISPLALRGLRYADARSMAGLSGMLLNELTLRDLWQRTNGNPKMIELSLTALVEKQGNLHEMDAFVSALPTDLGVRDYLMANLYAALPEEDRRALSTLSIFPAHVAASTATHVLAAQGISAVAPRLQSLVDKRVVTEDESGRIRCHSLVGEYSYRVLRRSERTHAHRQAANEYRHQRNFLEAAYHDTQAGQVNHAVRSLTKNARSLIAQGQGASLLVQLSCFDDVKLTPPQRCAVERARGDAMRMRGNYEDAQQAYEAALHTGPDERTSAGILGDLGVLHYRRWALTSAIERLEQSKAIANRVGDAVGAANASIYLGWSLYRQAQVQPGLARQTRAARDMQAAGDEFRLALETGLRLRDRVLAAKAMFGLGSIDLEEDRLGAARELLEESRALFEQVGDRELAARVATDLARVHGGLGDRETQRQLLEASVSQHAAIGNVDGLRTTYNNLGDLSLRHLHAPGRAIDWYEKLASVCRDTGHLPLLVIACAGLADACLALGAVGQARVHADEARRTAEGLSPEYAQDYLGLSYRVQGDVYLALGMYHEAQVVLAESVKILSKGSEIAGDELALAELSLKHAREHPRYASGTTT